MRNLIRIEEATKVASSIIKKEVNKHNLMYLIQYGKIEGLKTNNELLIDQQELEEYYINNTFNKKSLWVNKYGEDINWHLAFDNLKEKETTKHVHRIHPYKGKFIPQLVEYFLNEQTDNFKQEVYFSKGDTILDPFSGSGTTLVQVNEMGMNLIGIDVSSFNCMIGRVKLSNIDINILNSIIRNIENKLEIIKII